MILCNRELPAGQRALEINKGSDGKRYDVIETSEGNVCVKPWLFEQEKFTIAIEATYLNQVQFTDSAELTAALQNTPIKLLEWTLVKQ